MNAARLIRRGLGSADGALALLVVSVVAMMIVPLPTWLLDVLVATNLSASVAILLVVLYVPDALGVATFPTLLLLTTLYRLGLNIASSRLILLQADAGEVIRAFGAFVVRGNYVVGAVVFLVLTIIQFVVIARGGERVAEVGARFVLDAMPGKQMAIDAELRSGAIDGAEARRRRRALSRESQFYGSMDGAMKFVKGDVIASVIVTLVNIVGGIVIGVVQHGMPVSLALRRYGLLTIGDGLVSQIPALILSTAAGVLVTRTASEEPDTPLGQELARQLFSTPRALGAASVFVVALAAVPGLPAAPFLVLGAALAVTARARSSRLFQGAARARSAAALGPAGYASAGASSAAAGKGPSFVPVVVPWSVDVAPSLEPLLVSRRGHEKSDLPSALTALRETIFAELGVALPPPRVEVDPALAEGRARISLFEVPAAQLDLAGAERPEDRVALLAGRAHALLRARAHDFLGLSEVQRLLDELEAIAPATVRNVVPKPVALPLLVDILRRLVDEGISIRDLRAILEALAGAAPLEKDPLHLSEFVRAQLRRPITYRLTGGTGQLGVHLLDPAVEEAIRKAVTRTPSGAFLALAPALSRDIVAAVRRALAAGAGSGPAVLLTQPDIRRFVRKLVETDLPDLAVVSFAELLPEVSLRPLGKAALS